MATQSLGRIKICGSIGDAPSRTPEPRAAVVRPSAAGPPQLVAHRTGRPLGVNRVVLTVRRSLPVFSGGLNRSTQHFILKERWSVV